MRIGILVLVLLLSLVTSTVSAATYYVATTGSDGAAGSIGAPWASVAHALATMVAGDTTYLRGGTYTENSLNFANSGTAGNVITLAAYTGETPVIDSGLTVTSGRTPVFLINNRSYITLDGLTIAHGSTANIYLSYAGAATHITIQNCTLHTLIQEDNAAHIYMDPGSANITIKNNYIHDYITGGYTGNAANGIVIFQYPTGGQMDIAIENNEIYGNLLTGIHYKHGLDSETNSVTTIKNNLIHNTGTRGIINNRNSVSMTNNVIYGSQVGITLFIAEGAGKGAFTTIRHNTIVQSAGIQIEANPGTGPPPTGSYDNVLTDNIISGVDTVNDARGLGLNPFEGSDNSNTTLNYSLIYSASTTSTARIGSSLYTVATLPASVLGKTGLLATAPVFVNEAAHNYTLDPSSPGYHAASDGADMGVNFALVGVGNGAGSPITSPFSMSGSVRLSGSLLVQ